MGLPASAGGAHLLRFVRSSARAQFSAVSTTAVSVAARGAQADTSAAYLHQSVVTLPPGAQWWHVMEALVITGNGDLACGVTRKYQAEVMKVQLRVV